MIFIVDDNRDNAGILVRLLKRDHLDAHAMTSGHDLFEHLRAEIPPNLVILDVRMPEMDGWECLSVLRANPQWQGIPVVMYSAETSVQGSVVAEQLGAQGFVSKGSTPWADFLAKIKKLTDPLAG